jgi:hypothetical protein
MVFDVKPLNAALTVVSVSPLTGLGLAAAVAP